jgi:hypothetical protein
MAIEDFVRPAQTPVISPPRQVRQRRTVQNWKPIVLKFGVGGSINQVSASVNEQFTAYQVQRPTERQS